MGYYHKRIRVIYDDNDNELVWCRIHQEYLPSTEFQKSEKNDWGYKVCCEKCRNLAGNIQKSGIELYKENEKQLSNKILNTLGYSTDGDLSVYEQFILKYGDKINERKFVRRRKKP